MPSRKSFTNSRTLVDTEKNLDLKDHRSLILRYIAALPEHFRTTDLGLQLFRSTITQLIAYSDADWAGCPATRQSTFGYCVFLGDNLLMWSSKRQDTLSRSSAEAEYRGVANAVAKTSWFHNLLRKLHTPLFTATLVYCDNVSDVYMSANPVQHQRTKHIDIDIHFVRDKVAAGHVHCNQSIVKQSIIIFQKGVPSVKAPNDPNADDNMPVWFHLETPIVQSAIINTKSTSYAGASSGSKELKDQPKVNSNFRPLVADPVFDGVNISISRKVVEKGKKKKRKGKSKSNNGGQFVGPSVKQTVRYEPKATTNTPNNGDTNKGNQSISSSLLKNWGNSLNKDNITSSNSFSALNVEEEDEEEEVENGYDETANLFTKTGGSSSRLLLEEQAGDDVDLVDADDVDHFENLDLQNRVTKLEEDFTRMLKAKKAKEAKEP
ncbi:ribonuclease H-like domain-containing protein [Tanacetum coccineum]